MCRFHSRLRHVIVAFLSPPTIATGSPLPLYFSSLSHSWGRRALTTMVMVEFRIRVSIRVELGGMMDRLEWAEVARSDVVSCLASRIRRWQARSDEVGAPA